MPTDAFNRCPLKSSGALVIAACSLWAFSASGFECPEAKKPDAQGAIHESRDQIQSLSRLLESGDVENRIDSIVAGLKQRNPGVQYGEIMNYLTTAYCPVVARLSGLSNAEKRATLSRFDNQVRQTVYSEAGSPSQDAIR